MIRQPAVAGFFYPDDPRKLTGLIEELYRSPFGAGSTLDLQESVRVRAVVSPHAGYPYSGATATCSIQALAQAQRPATCVLLGPNHRGVGAPVALSAASAWKTPLGEVPVNTEAGSILRERDAVFQVDEEAHRLEHSIEVQLPFLQHILDPRVNILPISIQDHSPQTAGRIGDALAYLAERMPITILASSDFSHYEPDQVAREKDMSVLEQVCRLDTEGFFFQLREKHVSVCGPGGIAALITTHKQWGGGAGELLVYCTSGDTSGEKGSVVGYASVAFL